MFHIEPIDAPGEPENYSVTLHRTNVISTDYATGRKYNGRALMLLCKMMIQRTNILTGREE